MSKRRGFIVMVSDQLSSIGEDPHLDDCEVLRLTCKLAWMQPANAARLIADARGVENWVGPQNRFTFADDYSRCLKAANGARVSATPGECVRLG